MSFSSTARISDLFYSHIIPDLLSENLDHLVLAEDINSTWSPFYTLPLVSHSFYRTCQMMSERIFGVKKEEGGEHIFHILRVAREFWILARLPPALAMTYPIEQRTYGELMSSESVIQIYICTAIAQFYFNVDVLCAIAMENQVPRRMRDDTMHRVYLPLTCAMKLCDRIFPERLAYIIAKHLGAVAPRFSTAPLLLKYTQDLETYVAREHRVDLGTWIEWTLRTLDLIEGTNDLLMKMLNMGQLVNSYVGSTTIPRDVLNETNIVPALEDVMVTNWGAATEQIRMRAGYLLSEFSLEDLEMDYEEFDSEE